MHLSAHTYQEILRSLKSDSRPGTERRQAPRVGLRAKVTLITLSPTGQQGPPQAVWVRDLSEGGIGLVVTRAMARGDYFIIKFKEDSLSKVCLLCQVMQCRPLELIVGARIHRELTTVEVSDLNARRPLIMDPDEFPQLISTN